MFKKLSISIAIGIGLLAGSANAGLISSSVGDADCFGLGGTCADGDLWMTDLGGVFFTDYRSVSDPIHTDWWEARVNPTWTHSYSLGGETPTAAFFDLFIAGVADMGVSVNLFADATIIATYSFPNQFETVHALTAAVPLGLIDGSTTFSLDTDEFDGFSIDRSTLRIETVPEPTSMALIGLGLAGLGYARRRIRA